MARITQAAAKTCADKFPSRSKKFHSEFERWLERNQADIPRLKGECIAELRKSASSDTAFEGTMSQIDALISETVAEFAKRDAESIQSMCINVLSGMESGRSDLNRHFPPGK